VAFYLQVADAGGSTHRSRPSSASIEYIQDVGGWNTKEIGRLQHAEFGWKDLDGLLKAGATGRPTHGFE